MVAASDSDLTWAAFRGLSIIKSAFASILTPGLGRVEEAGSSAAAKEPPRTLYYEKLAV